MGVITVKQLENVLKQAKLFEEQGKFLHALQLYHTLLKNPKYKRIATVRLASAYERLKKADLAKEILQKYISENENDDEIKKLFCHFLIRNNYNEEALFFLSTISRDENPEILYLMGIANYKLRNFKIAELNFIEFVNENSKSDLLPEALFILAKIQIEMNKIEEALNNANKSAELFFQNFEIHELLARIYYSKEMYYHAQKAVKNALKINDKELSLLKCAGKIYFKLEEFKKAADYFMKYLEYYPNDEVRELLNICKKYIN